VVQRWQRLISSSPATAMNGEQLIWRKHLQTAAVEDALLWIQQQC
jgi:hypothetical protein